MNELGAAGGGRAERLPEVDELSGGGGRAERLPEEDDLGAAGGGRAGRRQPVAAAAPPAAGILRGALKHGSVPLRGFSASTGAPSPAARRGGRLARACDPDPALLGADTVHCCGEACLPPVPPAWRAAARGERARRALLEVDELSCAFRRLPVCLAAAGIAAPRQCVQIGTAAWSIRRPVMTSQSFAGQRKKRKETRFISVEGAGLASRPALEPSRVATARTMPIRDMPSRPQSSCGRQEPRRQMARAHHRLRSW